MIRQTRETGQETTTRDGTSMLLGVRGGRVIIVVDGITLFLSPDQADDLSTDLRSRALEARNGGRLL